MQSQLLPSLFHPGITLDTSVVIGIKPLIPGSFESAVIAIIKAMMQLVKKITQPEFDILSDEQVFVATM